MPLFQHLLSQHLLEQPVVLITDHEWNVLFSNERARCFLPLHGGILDFSSSPERIDFLSLQNALSQVRETLVENLTTTRAEEEGSSTDMLWQISRNSSEIHIVGFEITELRRQVSLLDYLQRSERIGGWQFCPRTKSLAFTSMAYEILDLPFGARADWDDVKKCLHMDETASLEDFSEKVIALASEEHSEAQLKREFRSFSKGKTPAWIEIKARLESGRYGKRVVGTLRDNTLKKMADEVVQRIRSGTNSAIADMSGFAFELEVEVGDAPFLSLKRSLGLKARHIALEKSEQKSLLETWAFAKDRNGVFQWRGGIQSLRLEGKALAMQGIFREKRGETEFWTGIALPFSTPDSGTLVSTQDNEETRMAAIGELASGMGHEINNPLSIIIGKVDRIRKNLAEKGISDPGLHKHLEIQERAALRIKKIVDGLRLVSRKPEESKEKVCLRDFLETFIPPFQEIDPTTRFVLKLSNEPLWAQFPRVALEQILSNLIQNGLDAMKNEPAAEIIIEAYSHSQGEIWLKVIDSGPGIPLELEKRIFEPFFTTKEVGKGTGLGLSLSASIASQLRGQLSLLREHQQKGACFLLQLPKLEDKHSSDSDNTKPFPTIADRPKIKAHCLLVDDDPLVRETIKEVLGEFVKGDIEEAGSTQEAVKLLLSERGKNIGVIFTDLSMGQARGEELINHIRKVHGKKHKLFVITGAVTPMNEELLQKIDGLITKPFADEDLAAVLLKAAS